MNMSTLCTIKYMNRSNFSKARYMIGVGFKILGRTLVPKLPPNFPPSIRIKGIPFHLFQHAVSYFLFVYKYTLMAEFQV